METFTEPKEFVENPRYHHNRERTLAALDWRSIDEPIVDIVAGFAALPHCFPQQSCYGHFICTPEQDSHTLDPVPPGHAGLVKYRIAYLALCLENTHRGWALRESLARVPVLDRDYVQFGCADWLWKRCSLVNSYALQVGPSADRFKDEIVLIPAEAIRTQEVRALFFAELRAVLTAERSKYAPG